MASAIRAVVSGTRMPPDQCHLISKPDPRVNRLDYGVGQAVLERRVGASPDGPDGSDASGEPDESR